MKRIVSSAVVLSFILLTACNNEDKKTTRKEPVPKTTADSLMIDVMNGHDQGMAKMSKLSVMQARVQQVLDSMAKLPAKMQEAADPYKRNLNGLLEDLKSAKDGMEKWMDEFNMDSAINNIEMRIKYLGNEKLKVSKVKENIISTLQKADSLLKANL